MSSQIFAPSNKRSGFSLTTGIAGVATFCLLLTLTACGNSQPPADGRQGPPPMPVTIMSVEPEDVAVTGEYAGRVQGLREVEVRARVAGVLEKRLHQEGRAVQAGEHLFLIDPEPYNIARQRAEAENAAARAELNQAEREAERTENLYRQNAVSQRERDQAQSSRELAQARLALSEAALADADRNLRYTKVEAPIAGISGRESLPEGSLIGVGTLLTTITVTDPVQVHFALPESDAALRAKMGTDLFLSPADKLGTVPNLSTGDNESEFVATKAAESPLAKKIGAVPNLSSANLSATTMESLSVANKNRSVPIFDPVSANITIRLADGSDYPLPGRVDFVAPVIDPRTGTVAMRAVFPNPESRLVPGQLVRVRLRLEKLRGVFPVPQTAVGNDRNGSRVFLVAPGNVAEARPVTLGPVVDGRRLITSGLNAGDQLVINGQVALTPGAPVLPSPAGAEE